MREEAPRVVRRRGPGAGRAAGVRGLGVNPNESRLAHVALREALLLGILALASVLFINHGILYLTGDVAPRSTRPESYALVTVVLYVFVRGIDLVLRVRAPRVKADLVLCPECGQDLADGTPKAAQVDRTEPLTPRPTEKEILAAVALRRAIDDARRVAELRGRGVDPVVSAFRGDFENAPAALLKAREELELPTSAPRVPREPWRPKIGR